MYIRKTVAAILLTAVFLGVFTPKVTYAQELNEAHIGFIDQYFAIAITYGAIYDIPWEDAMGIALYESGHGTSYSAINRHNFHGLSNGRSGNKNFATDEEGWEAFYKNLIETDCYIAHNVLAYRDDPNLFLEAITKAGYNPTPKQYLTKVGPFVRAVEEYRIERGLPSSREYSMMLNNVVSDATTE